MYIMEKNKVPYRDNHENWLTVWDTPRWYKGPLDAEILYLLKNQKEMEERYQHDIYAQRFAESIASVITWYDSTMPDILLWSRIAMYFHQTLHLDKWHSDWIDYIRTRLPIHNIIQTIITQTNNQKPKT
jgi:hypothetical protein